MRLLDYLNGKVSTLKKADSRRNHNLEAYQSAYNSLKQYLGENADTQLIDVLKPGWVDDYRQWLASEATTRGKAKISEATAEKHYDKFRSAMRGAIADGFLPPIDAFPSPKRTLDPDKSRGFQPYDFVTPFMRLLRIASSLPSGHPVWTYLNALFTLSPAAEIGGLSPAAGGWGATPISSKIGTPATASEIAAFLAAERIPLFRSRSFVSDALGIAIQRGIAPETAQRALAGDPEATRAVTLRISDDRGLITDQWYVLRSYAPRLRGTDIKHLILRRHPTPVSEDDLYDPYDEVVRKTRGKLQRRNSPAVSAFLFVRANRADALAYEKLDPNIAIIRAPGERDITPIPGEQVSKLRIFLNDRCLQIDDIVCADLQPGQQVRILTEPYAGLTGTILSSKPAEASGQIFTVAIQGLCVTIHADLSGLSLTPI